MFMWPLGPLIEGVAPPPGHKEFGTTSMPRQSPKWILGSPGTSLNSESVSTCINWKKLQETLEEQFQHLQGEGAPHRPLHESVATMSRIIHEVGDGPYNEGLAMAASALHMSVKVRILEWEFRCKWKTCTFALSADAAVSSASQPDASWRPAKPDAKIGGQAVRLEPPLAEEEGGRPQVRCGSKWTRRRTELKGQGQRR